MQGDNSNGKNKRAGATIVGLRQLRQYPCICCALFSALLLLLHIGVYNRYDVASLQQARDSSRPVALVHSEGGCHHEVASAVACALFDGGFHVTVLVSYGVIVSSCALNLKPRNKCPADRWYRLLAALGNLSRLVQTVCSYISER
jgi:hypothetical protein